MKDLREFREFIKNTLREALNESSLTLENSYLKRKGLLKEEAEQKVKITSPNSYGNFVFIGNVGRIPDSEVSMEHELLFYFKPEEGGFEFVPKGSGQLPSWVRGAEETFNNLIGKKIPIDYQGGGQGIKIGGEPNKGNMSIGPLISGDNNVRIQKI